MNRNRDPRISGYPRSVGIGLDRETVVSGLSAFAERVACWLACRPLVLLLVTAGVVGGLFLPVSAVIGGMLASIALAADAYWRHRLQALVFRLGGLGAPTPGEMPDWLDCHIRLSRLDRRAFPAGASLEFALQTILRGMSETISAGWYPAGATAIRALSESRRIVVNDYLSRSDDPAYVVEFLVAALVKGPKVVDLDERQQMITLMQVARTERLRLAASAAMTDQPGELPGVPFNRWH